MTFAHVVGAPQKPERFRTSTAAVAVDVVVRDHQGRPVTGLSSTDFTVFEDGVRQTITSFDAVGEADPAAAPETGELSRGRFPAATTSPRVPAVVALVFEQLSTEGRQLAEKAASAFVNAALTTSDGVAVFNLDRALHLVVPYTSDVDALRRGVHEASLRPGYPLEHAGRVPGAEYGSPEAGQPSPPTRDDRPSVRGRATFDALEALIDSMHAYEGRKAVIFFSEGLALMPSEEQSLLRGTASPHPDSWLSDGRYEHFLRVFERASRAHVSFYTFDAKGLRIEGPNVQSCFGCAPYVGLQMLADQTGGAFVDSTNDLIEPVRRVEADLRHYYLLGYTSTNPKVDAKYRRIEVKVDRKDVRILARKGYVASVGRRQ